MTKKKQGSESPEPPVEPAPTPEEVLARSDLSLMVLLRDQLQKLRISEGNRNFAAIELGETRRADLHRGYHDRLLDLEEEIFRPIRTLSHGYRQRVGVAQAIIHDPKFVILDEPTRGLDPVQIVDMRGLVKSLKQKHTVMISSHILTEIAETCVLVNWGHAPS